MEPWDALRMQPQQLFASFRSELESGELRRGHLDVDALRSEGSVVTSVQAEPVIRVTVDAGCVLAIKYPVFWRYLDRLPTTRFVVWVRHPREVIASCRKSPGDLALGLAYEVPFNRAMNRSLLEATDDVTLRRVLLYDYVNERILPHLRRSEVFVVRYERWFADPGVLLSELGRFLGADLSRPPAQIRPPRTRALDPNADNERQATLIRQHCRTAEALGYRLGEKG
ncbi:MAG: sulfotransferase [Actinomycetota bacterium]|nr:sulfotransferase [Actinomycetota bacterium]